MTERVVAPLDDCPKCGETRAFVVTRPIHVRSAAREWLEWPCVQCDYRVETPTLDATTTTEGPRVLAAG